MRLWAESGRVDRAAVLREQPEAVGELWRRPEARVIVLSEKGDIAVRSTEVEERHWLSTYSSVDIELATEKASGAWHSQKHILLGLVGGEPRFAMVRPGIAGTPVRELLPRVSDTDQELALTAVAVTNWHRANPRCPSCGNSTRMIMAGFARHCDSCSAPLFPRHDPAVIVAVLDDDDRLLLGHQSSWPEGRYSLLAGFVEAGESLEQCVHREVQEEVGIRLDALRYVGSQPWPFPRSLMCAYVAHAAGTQITVDGTEIADAAFFTRDEVAERVAAGTMLTAPSASVSAALINAWREDQLPAPQSGRPLRTRKDDPTDPTPAKRGW